MCKALWQGLWVQKIADKRPALEEVMGEDVAAVPHHDLGCGCQHVPEGSRNTKVLLSVSGGSWEAFSEETALQKHFDPRRESASHRGNNLRKAQMCCWAC